MKNAGMAGAVALVGVGLITIGLGDFVKAPQAMAASSAALVEAGPEEPTIVWYDVSRAHSGQGYWTATVIRAWSNGRIETRSKKYTPYSGDPCNVGTNVICDSDWIVLFDANEGLNAAADINFDEIVDGADMGLLLGNWGKAPRSPIPASDCPLGLMQ